MLSSKAEFRTSTSGSNGWHKIFVKILVAYLRNDDCLFPFLRSILCFLYLSLLKIMNSQKIGDKKSGTETEIKHMYVYVFFNSK